MKPLSQMSRASHSEGVSLGFIGLVLQTQTAAFEPDNEGGGGHSDTFTAFLEERIVACRVNRQLFMLPRAVNIMLLTTLLSFHHRNFYRLDS